MTAAIMTVAALVSCSDSPSAPDRSAFARPTGTTVTVDAAVADPPGAPTVTASQVTSLASNPKAARGRTFALAGSVQSVGTDAIAVIHPDGVPRPTATVLLRGALIADVYQDDQFRATVTVTDEIAHGLPVLYVTDIETF